MKNYVVCMSRNYVGFAKVEVLANNSKDAITKAHLLSGTIDFSDLEIGDAPDEVYDVYEYGKE